MSPLFKFSITGAPWTNHSVDVVRKYFTFNRQMEYMGLCVHMLYVVN